MRRLALFLAVVASASAQASLDRIFSPIVSRADPGLAVLVRVHGQTTFVRGYGVRALNPPAPISPATNFRLASFTKQFTAMAIMLLVHDGKLRYDETLTQIFPEFPAYGQRIGIRELLTHTAGLPNYEDLMGAQWSAERQITDAEVLSLLEKQSSGNFPPGTRWAYSNSAYVVLGLVVAKVSGESFPDFLRDRIFSKLHMDHTIAYVKGKNEVPNRAYGYDRRSGGSFTPDDQSATSATLGDGGVYSNLLDLAKWDDALRDHKLLSGAEMAPALTPVKLINGASPHWPQEAGEDNLAPGKPVSYGFGWFLDPYRNQPRMWHTGTTDGFRSVIERFTGADFTIVILANRTDLDLDKLALRAADLVLDAQHH